MSKASELISMIEAKVPKITTWEQILKLKEEESYGDIIFPDGKKVTIDINTVNLLVQIQGLLKKSKASNGTDFIDRVNKDKQGLIQMVNFVWKKSSFK